MEVKNTSKYFVDFINNMQNNYNNLQNSITERHSSCDKKIEIMNAVLEYNNYLNNQLNKNFDALKESNRINELTFDGEIANRKNIFNTNFFA